MSKQIRRDHWCRCPLCDEWYDPFDFERAKCHDHPEPQGGESRDAWIASRMPYEQWIVKTIEGRLWKAKGEGGAR